MYRGDKTLADFENISNVFVYFNLQKDMLIYRLSYIAPKRFHVFKWHKNINSKQLPDLKYISIQLRKIL